MNESQFCMDALESAHIVSDPVPKIPALYFLFNDNDLIYLGITSNLKQRLTEHRAAGRILFTRATYIDGRDEELEKRLIIFFRPLQNGTHNTAALPYLRQKQTNGKWRVTVTLDADVFAAVETLAKAQRDSFSGMVNRMLAQAAGLVPREKDRPWTA